MSLSFIHCQFENGLSEDGVGGGIGEAGTCCSRGARNSLRYKTGARPLPNLNGQVGFQHFLPLRVSFNSGISFPYVFFMFCGSSSLLPFGTGEYLRVFEKKEEEKLSSSVSKALLI